MFTIFVVRQFCVRAGTKKAVCVSPSPWIQKCGRRGCCSCKISIALQSLHHLGTTELHQNDRSQRCGLLFATKKTGATAGLSDSVATRGRSGGACVRPRSPACIGVRGLLFARRDLSRWLFGLLRRVMRRLRLSHVCVTPKTRGVVPSWPWFDVPYSGAFSRLIKVQVESSRAQFGKKKDVV